MQALVTTSTRGEEHLRALIDALPTAVYTTDAQGRVTHFNPACIELSGRTPEVGSDHWCVTWKLYHADGRPMPHDECPMAIALRERRIVRGGRAIAERPDGSRIWFEPYPTPLFDASGALVGGVNMLVDVTERVRSEHALTHRQTLQSGQREALQVALNGGSLEASLGVLAWTATVAFAHDTRAAFYLANEAGTALHHVVGMHPDYAAAVAGFEIGPESLSCGLAVATGQPVLTPDVQEDPRWKAWRWLAERFDFRGCWSFPIHTAARQFIGTLAIYWRLPREATDLDIELASLLTETASAIVAHHAESEARRRAERALRASETRFREMADSAPAMLWVTRPDGSASFVSRGWCEYTGQDEGETTARGGFGWLEALHPEDRESAKRSFLAANESRTAFAADYRVRRPNGEYRWCIAAGRPRFGVAGEFEGYVGSVIDVHERKQVEQALQDNQAALTAELADATLLAGVSAELVREENTQAVYEKLIDAAVSVMRSDFASMQMLDPDRGDGGELRLLAFRGFDAKAARFWEWVRTDSKCTCGVALATGQRCIEPDVEKSRFMAGTADQSTYLEAGIRAVQSTPLLSRAGNLVGMISTHWRQPHEPTERDLRLLDVLARQAADLIDRKRVEEVLRSSEERYRQLANLLPVAVYTCDAAGVITYYNQHAAELWGRSPEPGDPAERFCGSELLLRPDGSVLPHDQCPMALALREGLSFRERAVDIRRPDGSQVSVRVNIDPVRDASGRIVGAINVFHDVTDLRRAEAAVANLAAIVRCSTDAIISIDLNGVITSWNEGAERLFGYTAAETVGRPFTILVPPDRLGEEADILARIERGERIEHFETKRVRKDGATIDVSLTVSPLKDPNGRIVGASRIPRDITERVQAQEALREADRRKDEFLAMLAHELRGPLAPLGYVLEIMKRAEGDDELLGRARDSMDRQLGQLVRLVDDLLDVSRISRGRLELKRERVELASVLRQAVEACRPLAEIAAVDLIVTLPREPAYLHADAARLAQVLGNLLHNSCKYSEPGSKVWLTAERDGAYVALKVRDTGVGIPPEKLGEIFEMFAQVDHSLPRSQGGLGIGLTLVKQLVEMHGGSIAAFSDGPNTGSEFVIRLPVMSEEPDARATPQPSAKEQRGVRRQILVVDDNADSAASLAMLLSMTGNDTHTCHDGLAAVEAVEQLHPDIALLDIGLPKLDGYEVCRRIRAQPWGKDVRLVALTGWGQEEDRRLSREAGFDAHLVKPVDFGVLDQLLAQWCEGSRID
jgi:PAS domain S-box-containing protein